MNKIRKEEETLERMKKEGALDSELIMQEEYIKVDILSAL